MGRGRGKGKKFTLTNNDDPGSGEDERIPAQKRRGRPQKPLADELDEHVEKIEDDDNEDADSDVNGKKRKRNKQAKENEKGDLPKEEITDGTRANGFRHNGSRRKNKPHRAAEAGVDCKCD